LVFHRDGEPVGDLRKAWATACRGPRQADPHRGLPPGPVLSQVLASVPLTVFVEPDGRSHDRGLIAAA
jgi:hypothetical protein